MPNWCGDQNTIEMTKDLKTLSARFYWLGSKASFAKVGWFCIKLSLQKCVFCSKVYFLIRCIHINSALVKTKQNVKNSVQKVSLVFVEYAVHIMHRVDWKQAKMWQICSSVFCATVFCSNSSALPFQDDNSLHHKPQWWWTWHEFIITAIRLLLLYGGGFFV